MGLPPCPFPTIRVPAPACAPPTQCPRNCPCCLSWCSAPCSSKGRTPRAQGSSSPPPPPVAATPAPAPTATTGPSTPRRTATAGRCALPLPTTLGTTLLCWVLLPSLSPVQEVGQNGRKSHFRRSLVHYQSNPLAAQFGDTDVADPVDSLGGLGHPLGLRLCHFSAKGWPRLACHRAMAAQAPNWHTSRSTPRTPKQSPPHPNMGKVALSHPVSVQKTQML